MQIAYRAANLTDAHLVRQLLEAEGIPAFVQGEFLQGAVGELPANTEVLVHVPDERMVAARAIVADWDSGEPVGFEDEDEEPATADAPGGPASGQAHALALKRLLLFIAVVAAGVACYRLMLRYAGG